MEVLKCKICGGKLTVEQNQGVCICDSCGSETTLPKNADAQRIRLFNRGNRFRMRAEYDEAIKTFENVIVLDDTDPEAHWCLALSRHGIEYVDGENGKIPTCHRIGYETILNDIDYLDCISLANEESRAIYKSDAYKIAEVQKRVIQQSKIVEPYDIFICFKDKNYKGERTEDSVLAQELYERLTKENYKVFFSRVTLESKVGMEYEPYIFSALQSAKVMLVVGTDVEYVKAPWVKNEWSRYLALVKKDNERLLIPCIKDMDPDELPNELAPLQYQDMNKIGWLQELLHVIRLRVQNRVNVEDEPKNYENLLRRCEQCLEDKDWEKAKLYCERILDSNAEIGLAYYYSILGELEVSDDDELVALGKSITEMPNRRRAWTYGDPKLKMRISNVEKGIQIQSAEKRRAEEEKVRLEQEEAIRQDIQRKEQEKEEQKRHIQSILAKVKELENGSYLDKKYAAVLCCQIGKIKQARELFDFYDLLQYTIMPMCATVEKYHGVIYNFEELIITDDGHGVIWNNQICENIKKKLFSLAEHYILDTDGVVKNVRAFWDAKQWRDVKDIQGNADVMVCLKKNGTVSTAGGKIFLRKKMEKWKDMKQISISDCLYLGLTDAGIVYAYGENAFGQCEVSRWSDVVQVSAGKKHAVAVTVDGKALAVGLNDNGQCNVESWDELLAIKAYEDETIGLKIDGSLVSTKGYSKRLQSSPSNLFDLSLYNEYCVQRLTEKQQCEMVQNVVRQITQLWEEKGRLKLWQISRRNEIKEALESLIKRAESINRGLPEWKQEEIPVKICKWVKNGDTHEA